jgi:hypothetical protein
MDVVGRAIDSDQGAAELLKDSSEKSMKFP